jgi:HlyD family secretion protein
MNLRRSVSLVLAAAVLVLMQPTGLVPSRAAAADDGVVVGRGRLEPLDGYRHVSASLTSGRPVVARLLVHKGSRIRAGEITAELDQTETDRAAVAVDEAQLARTQAVVAQMKAGAKPAAITEQQALVRQREADLELADIERRRAELLRTKGAQSQAAFTFRTLDEAHKRALLDQAKSGLQALSEPRASDVAVAAADVAVARAQLAQARAQLEESIVRAPEDGVVTEIFTRAGERIGQSGIYELADLDHLYAIAEIDEAFASTVRLGQHAVLFDRLGRPLGAGTVVRVGQRVFDASRPSEDVMLGKNSRIVEVAVKPEDPARLPKILGLELVVKIATGRPKAGQS